MGFEIRVWLFVERR